MLRSQAVFLATTSGLVTLFLAVCAIMTKDSGVWIATGASAIVATCAIVQLAKLTPVDDPEAVG
jgi:hypothetical protein